ncbi:hypothetical protein D1007_43849 [Hordeum vulgare]|nr:hypothetical protein D1007_43849 [Hordeum vulgare]
MVVNSCVWVSDGEGDHQSTRSGQREERDWSVAPRAPASERISTRQLDNQDARFRLERLAKSCAAEEEGTAGLPCFRPRILKEPFPKGFTLERESPK